MLPSKKVSGQGRDRALNLLNKNVPRQDLRIHDNSRTIFVIDNGKQCLDAISLLCRVMAHRPSKKFAKLIFSIKKNIIKWIIGNLL